MANMHMYDERVSYERPNHQILIQKYQKKKAYHHCEFPTTTMEMLAILVPTRMDSLKVDDIHRMHNCHKWIENSFDRHRTEKSDQYLQMKHHHYRECQAMTIIKIKGTSKKEK